MKKISLSFFCTLFFVNILSAQYTNVMISNVNDPEEVTIRINPKSPNQVVAGANIDNVFRSNDGGASWTQTFLSDPTNGVWGDPIVFTDTTGDFYYSHLSNPTSGGSWVDRIVFTKSTDGGVTWWPSGTSTGKNGTKVQDKEGIVVNPFTNEIYVTWTQFDSYGSSATTDSSVIMFSKSSDAGLTWSVPLRISKDGGDCIDSDNTVEGAIPSVGPAGELYVVWTGPNGLVFNKSLDDGLTWLPHETTVTSMPGGWDYNIAGLQRCNGLPQAICDRTGGVNNGTIYVNWTDQRNGTGDTDVWLVKSTDGGSTWCSPIRVNNDVAGSQQFLSWMDVDKITGTVYCVFYDRRNYASSSQQTDVYIAKSVDGGNTFTNYKINQTSFIPSPAVFFGDYIGISAYNNMVRPIWMAYSSSTLSVWTALVDGSTMSINESSLNAFSPVELEQNQPNPFIQTTWIKFGLKKSATVNLEVFDVLGNKVATLYNKEQFNEGDYDYIFNATAYNLKSGIYYYSISCNEYVVTKKMIVY
ncbi:MAG: T9SS type A sorting domain-containing protein [Bacteroidetes bacterium]|nr:T9SS type A sorting domain-containing protein [Bacteroidota bacterium]